MKICKNCGKEIEESAVYCSFCGEDATKEPEKVYCIKCGKEMRADASFCPNCGAYSESQRYKDENIKLKLSKPEEKAGTAVCALIFAVIFSLIGVILGFVGLSKYENKTYRTMCVIAIIFGFISMFVALLNNLGVINLY